MRLFASCILNSSINYTITKVSIGRQSSLRESKILICKSIGSVLALSFYKDLNSLLLYGLLNKLYLSFFLLSRLEVVVAVSSDDTLFGTAGDATI